jgi:hypothetical protein
MVRVSVNGFSTRSEHANHYTTDVVNMYQCNTDMIEDTNEMQVFINCLAELSIAILLTMFMYCVHLAM